MVCVVRIGRYLPFFLNICYLWFICVNVGKCTLRSNVGMIDDRSVQTCVDGLDLSVLTYYLFVVFLLVVFEQMMISVIVFGLFRWCVFGGISEGLCTVYSHRFYAQW